MTQSWHDLLFAHWPIDPSVLARKLPVELPLDLFDDRAWIGVIPFHMTNVGLRGAPQLPGVSAFPELNVRTYVTLNGKPGVYFFSLDAASTLAVSTARAVFHLPYYRADMTVHGTQSIAYRSVRRRNASAVSAEFAATYEPIGAAATSPPGTLEHFLTERYCLYTTTRSGEPRRLEIHHQPWPLQPANAQIAVNTMAAAAGVTLPAEPPLLHFAKRMDVLAWSLSATT
jgi:uncharacterized protein YqjF (DUF2071 family)